MDHSNLAFNFHLPTYPTVLQRISTKARQFMVMLWMRTIIYKSLHTRATRPEPTKALLVHELSTAITPDSIMSRSRNHQRSRRRHRTIKRNKRSNMR
ncbi:hypothetical protein HZ326_13625 [Fusarium oxysporum f. sp. albedinis]|nr:hypothetical protein HZ326_13625 [Fusarium oxysporum f. sp. albedinis]